jgi:DNA-binding CsgD family transcriptional regulator
MSEEKSTIDSLIQMARKVAGEVASSGGSANNTAIGRAISMACTHLSNEAGYRSDIAELVFICRLALNQSHPEGAEPPRVADRASKTDEPRLTERQLEVLRLLARGLTYQEVSEKLAVSPLTVKNHASAIYDRLGVANKTEAIFEARALGLVH